MLRRSSRLAGLAPRLLMGVQRDQAPIQRRAWTSGSHEDVGEKALKPLDVRGKELKPSGTYDKEMGFMESARIVLDPNTPRSRIVGRWDWHLVHFLIALLPAVAIYFLAQHARHLMARQSKEAEKKEAQRRAIAEERARQRVGPLTGQGADLQQRVKALEDALRELREALPTNSSAQDPSLQRQPTRPHQPSAGDSSQPQEGTKPPTGGPLTPDAPATSTPGVLAPSASGAPPSASLHRERGREDASPTTSGGPNGRFSPGERQHDESSASIRGNTPAWSQEGPGRDTAAPSKEGTGSEEGLTQPSVSKRRGFSVLGWSFWGGNSGVREGGPGGPGDSRDDGTEHRGAVEPQLPEACGTAGRGEASVSSGDEKRGRSGGGVAEAPVVRTGSGGGEVGKAPTRAFASLGNDERRGSGGRVGEGPTVRTGSGGAEVGGLLSKTSAVGGDTTGRDTGEGGRVGKDNGREGEDIARRVAGSDGAVEERVGDGGGLLQHVVRAWRARANRSKGREEGRDGSL